MVIKKLNGSIMVSNDDTFVSKDIKEMCLEYYVVEGETLEKSEEYNGKTYGIEVIKKETTKGNLTFMENVLVKDISCNENYVREIAEILANHSVTPVTLKEILGDVIGTEIIYQPESITSVA